MVFLCVCGVCVISGFLSEVAVNCDLLGHYAASSGNFLPTFRDNALVPSSRAKNPNRIHVTSSPDFSIAYPIQSR